MDAIDCKDNYLPVMEEIIKIMVNCITQLLLSQNKINVHNGTRNKCNIVSNHVCNELINDFCREKQTCFKVNGMEYVMYNHIIKEMMIFDTHQNGETFEITWNISPEKINLVFHFINDKNYKSENKIDLSNSLNIIGFMRHLNVTEDIMKETIDNIIDDCYIIDFLDECNSIAYDENMMCILDVKRWFLCYSYAPSAITSAFRVLITKLMIPNFPIEFKKKIIQKIIFKNIFHIGDILDDYYLTAMIEGACENFDCYDGAADIKRHVIIQIGKKNDYLKHSKKITKIIANYIAEVLLLRHE
jgi:ribosomal protein L22